MACATGPFFVVRREPLCDYVAIALAQTGRLRPGGDGLIT
jgi:hypothetical protein